MTCPVIRVLINVGMFGVYREAFFSRSVVVQQHYKHCINLGHVRRVFYYRKHCAGNADSKRSKAAVAWAVRGGSSKYDMAGTLYCSVRVCWVSKFRGSMPYWRLLQHCNHAVPPGPECGIPGMPEMVVRGDCEDLTAIKSQTWEIKVG